MGLPLPDLTNVEEKKRAGLKVTEQGNDSEINSFKQGWSDMDGNSDELSEDEDNMEESSAHLIMLVVTMTPDQLSFNSSSPRPPLTLLLIFFLSDFNALPSASEKIDGRASDHHKIASCHRFLDSPGSMDLGFQGYIHSE
ncbi:hypothetical protein D5086_016877 [Populus alba]|uniref:Uncharacterized protein n=1 Tax=Populus alba TaxID=43335 RepID=A0ACC4BVB0_POPAL